MGDNKGYVNNTDERGSVNIAEEVIAVIAASAALEVEGVHGLYISHSKELTSVNGRKGLSKGVKLVLDGNEVTIDVQIVAEMGFPVNDVGAEVQKAVISSVESAVGVKTAEVNVHICGVVPRRAKPSETPTAGQKKPSVK